MGRQYHRRSVLATARLPQRLVDLGHGAPREATAIMLEPPDTANRPPLATDRQGHPVSPAPATAAPRSAGQTAVLPAGIPGHALDGAIGARDGARRGSADHATRYARDPAGGSSAPDAVTRDDAIARRDGRDGAAAPPDSSWSHDWLQLSHELRTPLNAILGNIELLLDGSAGPLAAPVRACVGDIQVASRQLLHQLQPLLLLVQARTSGALATRMPLDLLALIRQASADAARRPDPGPVPSPDGRHMACAPACLPESASLMVPGDPIWLGALAATLVDLHATTPGALGPLSITLEPPGPGGGVVLRASWAGLDPARTSPVPLALIDAVLALHGGRIRAFCGDGLRLDLPFAVAGAGRRDHGPG